MVKYKSVDGEGLVSGLERASLEWFVWSPDIDSSPNNWSHILMAVTEAYKLNGIAEDSRSGIS